MTEIQFDRDAIDEIRLHGGPHLPITLTTTGSDVNPGMPLTRHPYVAKIKRKKDDFTSVKINIDFQKTIDPNSIHSDYTFFATNTDNSIPEKINSSYYDQFTELWKVNIDKKTDRYMDITFSFDLRSPSGSPKETRGYIFIVSCSATVAGVKKYFQGATLFQIVD